MVSEYTVKEIFYSLQGEGFHTGRPAVFVRFCGCNLRCPFCDTDFLSGETMGQDELLKQISACAPDCHFVVLTGGEPTLQVGQSLIDALHKAGYYVAMETNGTRPLPRELDWVTVSPKGPFLGSKADLCPANQKVDEVKVVYNGENSDYILFYDRLAPRKYIQPCDTGNSAKNKEIIKKSVEWLKAHPSWRLSLQTQKIINVR